MDNSISAAYVSGVALGSYSHCTFLRAKCPLKARIWPRKGRSRKLLPSTHFSFASAKISGENYDDDNDDDATMGETAPKFGMAMPNLSTAEKEYLEAATSSSEYMRRMTEIVRRKDDQRKAAMSKEMLQGAEEYLESLSRPTAPPSDAGPPRVSASDAYMEDLARKWRAARGIEDPPMLDHRSATAPAGAASVSEEEKPDELESLEDRIKRLQDSLARVKDDIDPNPSFEDAISIRDAIRRDIGLDSPLELTSKPPSELMPEPISDVRPESVSELPSVPISEVSPELVPEPVSEPVPEPVPDPSIKPQVIDKQIDFLQNYLEKLKQEEANENTSEEAGDPELSNEAQMKTELESNMNQLADKFTPQIEGLADTPGGMSASEKMAAFKQLREQAMKASKQEPQFSDPYNIVLPSKKTDDDDGEEPSSGSEAEYDEIGSQLHSKDLLIEEIELELARYVTNVKSLLQKHDARMQVLIARLKNLK